MPVPPHRHFLFNIFYMEYLLLSLAILLILVGIVGCLLPVLPGPPLSYAGILILHFTSFADFSKNLLIILAVAAGIVKPLIPKTLKAPDPTTPES